MEEVLRQYGKMDIAIQECVKPAESLKSIYPYAINTFRIMTYILDEKFMRVRLFYVLAEMEKDLTMLMQEECL